VRELIAIRREFEAQEAEREKSGGGGEGVAEGSMEDEQESEEEGGGSIEITCHHCVFCWAPSESVEANLLHMKYEHSFYVPDMESCVDLEGLIERMHELIIDERRCLMCESQKQFASPEDCQQHMADKAHCRIPYDEDRHFAAWENFYNYEGQAEQEDSEEGVGSLDSMGNLVLPGGKVAYSKEVSWYLKQRVALPDQRESVRTVMNQLALANSGGGGGSYDSSSNSAVTLRAAVAHRLGTRGNNTDAEAQKREQKARAHNDLRVGMGQNQIRRRYFRVQTTLTGVRSMCLLWITVP